MSRHAKTMRRIIAGMSDRNIDFDEMLALLLDLGFALRVRGSHHILSKPGVQEIINIQPLRGGQAKAYQVKQVRELLLKYRLGVGGDEV